MTTSGSRDLCDRTGSGAGNQQLSGVGICECCAVGGRGQRLQTGAGLEGLDADVDVEQGGLKVGRRQECDPGAVGVDEDDLYRDLAAIFGDRANDGTLKPLSHPPRCVEYETCRTIETDRHVNGFEAGRLGNVTGHPR